MMYNQSMIDPIGEIYKDIKDDEPFFRLVDEFYAGVENDSILRPMYPEELSEAKRHLALFLIQRTGGRTTYSNERGHPRMRGRHMKFSIGTKERDAWLENMSNALDKVPEFDKHRDELWAFFDHFANFMMNRPD